MAIRDVQELLVKLSDRVLVTDDIPEITTRILGNMNDIYQVKIDGQHYGLRVRTQDFQTKIFEQRIIKEIFAIYLLNEDETDPEKIRLAVTELLSQDQGQGLKSDLIKDILKYDWSHSIYPNSYTFYKWNEGECLWMYQNNLEAHYKNAGALLGRVHHIHFDSFYEDLHAISDNKKQSYADKYWGRMTFYLEKASETLEGSFLDKIKEDISRLELESVKDGACLVHNDYTGGNILVHGDEYKIIDWDVWEVNRPEADMISQKYFTKIDGDILVPDQDLYQKFLDGYQESGEVLQENILRAEEIKWLLRLYLHFTHARREVDITQENQANVFTRFYPDGGFFFDGLRELIE